MEDLIVKHNQVIKASYRLSPNEQAIILSALSKIPCEVTDQELYTLNVKEMAKQTGISQAKSYQTFKNSCFDLQDKKITIVNGKKNKRMNWVQTVEYIDGEGLINIRFGHDILPYLTNLKENFTSYNLKNVSQFKSTYGVRIYELLKQWQHSKKHIDIALDDLKEMLLLGKTYDRMSNLKQRIIEPSIKDINTYSDLNVKYENIKKGRKIIAFRLIFKPKTPSLTKEFIEQNARAGESWEEARERLTNN